MTTATIPAAAAPYRYVRPGSTVVLVDGVNAVAHIGDTPRPWAIGYRGKAERSSFNYSFRTVAARDQYVADFFANVKAHADRRAQQAAERRDYAHGLMVGSVLVSTWGYEQTNVDFYEVVAVPSSKTVRIRPIAQTGTETGFMTGSCTPVARAYTGDATLHRVRQGDCITIGHHSASRWNGTPTRWSSYA